MIRLGIDDIYNPVRVHLWLFIFAPLVSIPLFIHFGMYRAVRRYFGNDALITIVKAVSLSSLILTVVVYWYSNHQALVPRSIIFIYWWLSLLIIGGLRLCMRQYFMGDWFAAAQHIPFTSRDDGLTKVAIYGAGVAGNQLVAALRMGRMMRPVAFIDDDPSIAYRSISGLQVYKPKHIQRMINVSGAQEMLLALPSSTCARRREILSLLEGFPLHVRSVPNFMDLASGRVKVDIADLLGRDTVPAQTNLLERCIKGKTVMVMVMVTGAGGSIGSELCRQFFSLGPSTLLLFEHSELNLYSILSELEPPACQGAMSVKLLPILGSIRHQEKLLDVRKTWKVDTVYHAAAYKHVPMIEHYIAEGVK